MNRTRKIVSALLAVTALQLAAGLLAWGYLGKISVESSDYFAFIAMGLLLLSSLVILAGLYLVLRSSDGRVEESIRNLEELNTTLRAQRHDYLNHFQVIYGLMELEEYEEARKYLEPVFKDILRVGKALKTSQPAVNALLQAKLGAAQSSGIEMYLEVHSELKQLPVEPWNLCRVLSNIIDNGIRALKESEQEGERILRVTIREDMEGFCFIIANNGPVIPQQQREKIFRQGFTTKTEQGHGMGLYIVNRIVMEAGGRITLESEEGGTVFEVWLPRQKSSVI